VDVCQLIPSFEFKVVPEKPTALNNCGFDSTLDFDSFLEHEIRVAKITKNKMKI
jgi:hypothetical protein